VSPSTHGQFIGPLSHHASGAITPYELIDRANDYHKAPWETKPRVRSFDRLVCDPTKPTPAGRQRAINNPSSARGLRHFKCNHLKCAGNQRIDTVFNIGLFVEYLDINGHAFPFVAHHVSRQIHLVRQAVLPAIGEFLLKLIREYSVRMIAYNRNMRQLLYRKRKGLSTAKNRITSQEHDWPSVLYVTLRFEVPSLEGRKVIFAWANLRLPVESDPLAVAKAIDNRDRNTILPSGVVANINDNPFQVPEVMGNLVKSGSQSPLANAFQLEDPNVAEFPRPAVAKHPGLSRRRPPETIVDQSPFGRFEELLNLASREFLPKSGLFFRGEVSFLPMRACLGLQLYMPVI
jgi:hypothetical protein